MSCKQWDDEVANIEDAANVSYIQAWLIKNSIIEP